MIMKCKKCNKEHDGSFGSGKFCSRKCANSRSWTKKDKEKKSIAAKNNPKVRKANIQNNSIRWDGNVPEHKTTNKKGQLVPLKDKICPICNKTFHPRKKTRIYCSRECFHKDSPRQFAKKSSGGLRKGAGRGKSGYYQGVWCDSTYELAYLIYCKQNNISIKRNKQYWTYYDNIRNNTFKYYPDFIVNETITEIKGYESYVDKLKYEAVIKDNKKIVSLYKKDLKDVFEFVEKYTGIKIHNLWKLYDTYKPKYIHQCINCNKSFESEKENSKCCSRKCSGQYVGNSRRKNNASED